MKKIIELISSIENPILFVLALALAMIIVFCLSAKVYEVLGIV